VLDAATQGKANTSKKLGKHAKQDSHRVRSSGAGWRFYTATAAMCVHPFPVAKVLERSSDTRAVGATARATRSR